VYFVVHKTTSEQERVILTTLYLASSKNTDIWRPSKGDLQHVFPLNVSMVPSSAITIAADGERFTCGGFSFGETIHIRNFKFIIDYFGGLSLSPRRCDAGAAIMGSTCSGAPTPRRDMMEDSTKKFLTLSSREGASASPLPEGTSQGLRCSHHNHTKDGERSGHSGHDDGSPMDVGSVIKNLPPFRATSHSSGGSRRKPVLDNSPPSNGQCHGDACSPTSKPLPWFNRRRRHGMSSHTRRRGS
jgi:hypothetical protein